MSLRVLAAILVAFLLFLPAGRLSVACAATTNAGLQLVKPGTLSICSAINRPPMEFYDATRHPVGLDITLGTALAKQLGLQPRFLNIDFAGLIPALRAGGCDIILAQLFIRPERLLVIDEIPYMFAQTGILIRAGGPAVAALSALSGKTVVAVAGTTSADRLAQENLQLGKAQRPAIHIVLVPGNVPALLQLLYRQADAYAVAYETGAYYASLRPGIFALAGAPYFKTQAGIGIAKNRPALRAALQAALAELRKDGAYAEMFQKSQLSYDMLP